MSTTKPVENFAPTLENSEPLKEYITASFQNRMPSLLDFMLGYKSITALAKYLMNYTSQSPNTLFIYGFGLKYYCDFAKKNPDELVSECFNNGDDIADPRAIAWAVNSLDDFVCHLKAKKLAPGTVVAYIRSVKSFYRANGIVVNLPHPLPRQTVTSDRSPTPDELQRLVDMADLRQKVIISLLALGGFRVGTLSKLQYRHVKHDLEAGIVPIHIHIESNITKGKYGEYDTFIGKEAAEYLKAYLDQRRRGTSKVPTETIKDTSPLIRSVFAVGVEPINSVWLSRIVSDLYVRAGLTERFSHRHDLVTHSLRKYFRTQLGASIPSDYVEYMMGHKGSVYNDIRSKGIEFLRGLYASANLSLKPRTTLSEIDILKTMIRGWGKDPEQYLSKEALNMPHRACIRPGKFENQQVNVLRKYLRELIKDDQGGCI